MILDLTCFIFFRHLFFKYIHYHIIQIQKQKPKIHALSHNSFIIIPNPFKEEATSYTHSYRVNLGPAHDAPYTQIG
jgi:hypothetical protein